MSILITPQTKILVQGITGAFGGKHAQLSLDYGTLVVAGVTPGKGGQFFEHNGAKVPIFNSVADAAKATGATVSAIFVPPPFAGDAILECVDAGLELAVAITEGIPIKDMVRVKRAMAGSKTRLVGPNCPGIVTPGTGKDSNGGCRIGIAPGYIHKNGHVGVVSRSGTLTYEAVFQLTSKGIGQSTSVGIGGDPVNGTSHLDVIKLFNADPDTHAIILIGEIGGNAEVEAARWIKANCKKPVAGFIAGATAPAGRRMGHAGAIVGGAEDTAAAKIAVFQECGIEVAVTPSDMADALIRAAKAKGVTLELMWVVRSRATARSQRATGGRHARVEISVNVPLPPRQRRVGKDADQLVIPALRVMQRVRWHGRALIEPVQEDPLQAFRWRLVRRVILQLMIRAPRPICSSPLHRNS